MPFYSIAGLSLELNFEPGLESLIPRSFAPFAVEVADADPFMQISISGAPIDLPETLSQLDSTTNDLGTVTLLATASGYRFDLVHADCPGDTHHLVCDRSLRRSQLTVDPGSPRASEAVNSLIRIAFSQACIPAGRISVHASAVCFGSDEAILFLAPSGTGKSTQARLWVENIPGASLLNDDNPILAAEPDGSVSVYGSPWSGKTPCYIARRASVRAIVRIVRDSVDRLDRLSGIDSFICLAPSCSVIKSDPALHNAWVDTLVSMSASVIVGRLHCTPTTRAALVCHDAIS
ncbi:MAG: hypothetical protein NC111_02760 [Bacteroides sp.]|nr:hypothetical protein [Bacteroides sp.]MCM1413251.1 hypothetical protein [Bacteroides sp.]MCM1471439.1 hypothetical protein [Bacteroides sp.]